MDKLHLQNPFHLEILKYNLKNLFSSSFLSDVVLITPNRVEIRAHKIILAAYSDFFRTKFSTAIGCNATFTETKEGNDNEDRVFLELTSDDSYLSDAFSDVIRYLYSGEITLTSENVFAIMEIESLLLVSSLRPVICHYLRKILSKSNCLYIAEQCELFGYYDLLHQALLFSNTHFFEIISEPQFLEMSFKVLKKCLESSHLAVPTEDELCLKLCEWVKHDMVSRSIYLKEILQFVDPLRIKKWQQTVREVKVIFAESSEIDSLNDWLREGENSIKCNEPKEESRYCELLSDVVLAIGGYCANSAFNSVECLYSLQQPWSLTLPTYEQSTCSNLKNRPIPLMIKPRWCMAATSSIFDVYVIGSYDERGDCTTAECYNVIHNVWTELPSLPVGMISSAAAYTDGNLYCSGGCSWGSSPGISNDLWVLTKNAKVWRRLAPMQVARCEHQMVAHNGVLFVIGGVGHDGRLNSMERYDPFSDSWIFLKPMHLARKGHGCIVKNDHIYAVGGRDNSEDSYIEKFDIMKNMWTGLMVDYNAHHRSLRMITSLRQSVKCVAFENDILIISGFQGQRVELVNLHTDFSSFGPTLNQTRIAPALVSVKIPIRKKPPI